MNEPTTVVTPVAMLENAAVSFGTDSVQSRRQILFDKECTLFIYAVICYFKACTASVMNE